MPQLSNQNLHARVDNTPILKGVNLKIQPGKIHALMGPNGSGKSTLASVIAGHAGYRVTRGSITYGSQRLNSLKPDQRARLGIFLSFQYPVEVPGLGLEHFLRTAYNNTHTKKTLSAVEFHQRFKEKSKIFNVHTDFSKRSVNEGFSGGEKKKSEILQLALLEPTMAILDETDSGLDVDALKVVAHGLQKIKTSKMGILIITHYSRILRYIKPDKVHIMHDGRIIKSGSEALATQVEKKGYDWLIN